MALRWAWRRLEGQPATLDSQDLWAELAALLGEEDAWLGWLCTTIASRLRREVPLATLLARWVAVLRPDLALHAYQPLGRLVAMLRDQESGATSRTAPRRGATHQPEELYDQLADACGADWQQVRVMSEGFFKDLRV
ncbi:unnamed protein product [Durusdinium trenchii]|uniref:Uncharacterized protein n=1 Tax=Durusdinium trenchii TaxID=1381693 RepID=A0ABP0R3Z1_9DINO